MDAREENSGTCRVRQEFDAAPGSVAQARSFVAEMVKLWGCDDPMQVAALLTSEVVTNAVRHAAENVSVELELESDGENLLTVQTLDQLPGEPIVKPISADADSGRGMFLVDRLARRWGVEHSGEGKIVWFEVPVNDKSGPDQTALEG